MASFALDTSCMVAAVCGWHEHHERAAAAVNQRLQKRQPMVIPAPALVETYAVLTRLPPPHRLSATDAWRLVEANFVEGSRVTTLSDADYIDLLRAAAELPVAGGRVYDSVIVRCAMKGRAACLLTFNDSDFTALAAPHIDIVVP